MGDSPLVTVITATYNGERSLPYTLQSAINQDFKDFEIWVVGDGCTDGSAAVVYSFDDPRLKWVNLPRNSGSQSAPNNEGLRRARGRYIAFLGHDDLWFPWHLSTLLKVITAEKADFAHALCVRVGPQGFLTAVGAPPPGKTYAHHFGPPSSWLHKREVVEKIGYWQAPDTLRWAIDYDVFHRAYNAGFRMAASRRVSVLKFPSHLWRSYTADSAIPQASFAGAIAADPQRVIEDALLDLGVASYLDNASPAGLAAHPAADDGQTSFVRLNARRLVALYGRERWPVGPLLRYRYRRFRDLRAKERGL